MIFNDGTITLTLEEDGSCGPNCSCFPEDLILSTEGQAVGLPDPEVTLAMLAEAALQISKGINMLSRAAVSLLTEVQE